MQELHTALTNFNCQTHDDIATATGWDVGDVGIRLSVLRAHSDEYGWTVPHAAHGPVSVVDDSPRYFVVSLDDVFDAADTGNVQLGALSTLRTSATGARNEAKALLIVAKHLSDRKLAKRLTQTAEVFNGAAAMAERMADELATVLQLHAV